MGKSLVEHFASVEDPRRGRISYDLGEMLVIVTCALFAQVETYVDIADWARTKESWFRRFLRLENGLPSHDTLNRVFRLLDPKAFESVFRSWVGDVMTAFEHVAMDGKTIRGSGKKNPVHLVSAFATDLGLVLGQQRVADKGGELGAIPELLRTLELKGCLVSLDALGCQRDMAASIREQEADYLLCVKGNQPNLRQALETAFGDFPDPPMQGNVQVGHGRQTFQIAQVIPNSGQVDTALWADCKSLGRIVSMRVEKDKPRALEIRYYISSALLDPDELTTIARRHWAIENGLHWYLDVMLREDACAVCLDHGPQNLSIVRRFILNLLKLDDTHSKISLRRRRNLAAWDDEERARILGMVPI